MLVRGSSRSLTALRGVAGAAETLGEGFPGAWGATQGKGSQAVGPVPDEVFADRKLFEFPGRSLPGERLVQVMSRFPGRQDAACSCCGYRTNVAHKTASGSGGPAETVDP